MSLVFSPTKVATVPMVTITEHQVGIPIFIYEDKKEKLGAAEQVRKTGELMVNRRGIKDYFLGEKEGKEETEVSSQSSSIGLLSSSLSKDEEETGDEVQSKLRDDELLGSLTCLEECLPIKRGLSNFISGKSKSFASLAEATSCNATDLVKPENPLNKRRRIIVSCKAPWRRRASSTSLITSFSPLLRSDLVKEDEGDEEEEVQQQRGRGFPLAPLPIFKKSSNNSRSHSLSDLQKL